MLIFSILIAIMCPLLGLIVSGITTSKNTWLRCLLMALVIAIPSLFFVPDLNMDATVYYNAMNTFRRYSNLKDLFGFIASTPTILSEYKSYPGMTILLYLIGKTGYYTILSFLTLTLSYFAALLSVRLFYNNKRTYGYLIMLVVALLSVHYLFSMSVIRFYLAVSVLIIVVLYETKSNNKLYKILYIIPILIHPGIVPPVALILVSSLFKRVSNKIMYLLIVAIPVIFSMGSLIQKLNINGYIGTQIEKLLRYVNKSDLVTMFTTTKTWIIEIMVIIYLVIFVIFIYLNKDKINLLKVQHRRLVISTYYFTAFTIGIAPFNIIFIRYMAIAIPLTLACLSVIVGNEGYRAKWITFFALILVILAGIFSNTDILNVTFNIPPIKALCLPLFETFKLITKY
ncbi:hypothetical protein KY41_10185 [Latilactobacillus sakei]|nr:hypothetical protein KY41_10185 [Latilactobacillus sakei]USF96793.1 hypothetical protein A4W82_08185 [Latilactobacillus sakei]